MKYVYIHGEFGSDFPSPWINLHPDLSLDEMATFLSDIKGPVTLVGHSYGAFRAMQLKDAKIERMILVAPIGLTSRLGLFGQVFGCFFKMFSKHAHAHIGWTRSGFEWLDVIKPPKNAHVLFGINDLIIPHTTDCPSDCHVYYMNCGHSIEGFIEKIEELLNE